MSGSHQIVGWGAIVLTLGLGGAALWSWWTARRTNGRADHRFLVDRLILASLAVVAIAAALGVALLSTGARPTDPLHLLYALLALVTVPLGWAIGGRARPGGVSSRRSRDGWVAISAAVLLAIEARLILTG